MSCDVGRGWRPIFVDDVSYLGLYLIIHLLQAKINTASDMGASRKGGEMDPKVR